MSHTEAPRVSHPRMAVCKDIRIRALPRGPHRPRGHTRSPKESSIRQLLAARCTACRQRSRPSSRNQAI
eukprot:6911947-Pyramimonas_sp.AAC.1